jgi:hypothetical protein
MSNTHQLHQTQSIAHLFPQAEPCSILKRSTIPAEPPTRPCEHLRGSEYQEYILRIQTQSLGGVSHSLRSRIIRQLFLYKFPELSSENQVPENGNKSQKVGHFTNAEKAKLDETLIAWARWEVDYTNGFVKSTKCSGVTQNDDGICSPCKEVAADQSFKKAVNRVRRSFLRCIRLLIIVQLPEKQGIEVAHRRTTQDATAA